MKKLTLSILTVLGVIGLIDYGLFVHDAVSVAPHDRYRTFTREVLKSEYLNDWQDDTVNKLNELIALHGGDSTLTVHAAHDTLSALNDPQLTLKSSLKSLAAEDSIEVHRANIDRLHADTIFVGATVPVTPAWALGVTAGNQSHFSYADVDTLNTDSLTVAGTTTIRGTTTATGTVDLSGATVTMPSVSFSAGQSIYSPYARIDTLSSDSLTVEGPTTMIGAVGVTGAVTATSFVGDGSAITGITTSVTYDQSIAKLDTTISSVGTNGGGGSKVIVGSLLNWDDNCVGGNHWLGRWDCSGSYEAWREKEKSTSWYQAARGDTTKQFPTNYIIKNQVAQDSTTIWNRDTGELWMAFEGGASGKFLYLDTNIELDGSPEFKDANLYIPIGGSSGSGLMVLNFLSEIGDIYHTSGNFRSQNSNGSIIQYRNSGASTALYSSSPSIANNAVNAVAVTRDPFGLTDVNGAPKHWWMVGLQSATQAWSKYNPHTDTIQDRVATFQYGKAINISRSGNLTMLANNTGGYGLAMAGTIFHDENQHRMTFFYGGAGDPRKIDFATGTVLADAAVISGRSIVGRNADIGIVGGTEGLYNIHYASPNSDQTNTEGAKQRFSSTVNAPVEFGDAVLTLAFEDNTTDSSPYGNTLTATNGGTVSAVFGNGYSATAGSYLNRIGDAEFNLGTTDFSVHFWFKMAANPPVSAILTTLRDVSEGDLLNITMATDGTMDALISDDGGSTSDQVSPSADVADNLWHHFAFVRDSEVVTVYYDGVNVGTDAVDAVTTGMLTDDITIGANVDPVSNGGYADGLQLDDWSLSPTSALSAEAIAKIHAEGRKQLNRGGSPINRDHLHAADVDYVDALDNGIWLAGNEDSLTVFDGRLALQTYGTSLGASGTINDAKLIQNAGTDSVGVIIVTNTETILIQPDVNLEKMASSSLYHKEPILISETVVVDSAGVGGIFWTGQDAHDAAKNAGRLNVLVMDGTYGPVDVSYNSLVFRCVTPRKALSDNGGAMFDGGTSDNALDFTGGTVENCGFYNAGGGAGGNFATVSASGGGAPNLAMIFRNNFILDSDDEGINWNANQGKVIGNVVVDADARGICLCNSSADGNEVVGNHFQSASNGWASAAGANYNTITGNAMDVAGSDGGTGNVEAGSSVY